MFITYFGVMLKFKKTYKHDELLEAQTTQTHLNNISFMNTELQKVGKKLSTDYLMREYELDEGD